MTREQAIQILKKYNKEEYHIKHAFMVESIMKHFAKKYGYEEEFWGIVGLLHDVDYEMYPNEHCEKAKEILKEEGADEKMIHAVCSHGYNICSDILPEHDMEKVLYACDELTGIIASLINMRPSKNAQGMEVTTLKKKFKDKTFARGCDRNIIKSGVEMLGIELEELFENAIRAIEKDEKSILENMENKKNITIS